jgi:hypothetical protein
MKMMMTIKHLSSKHRLLLLSSIVLLFTLPTTVISARSSNRYFNFNQLDTNKIKQRLEPSPIKTSDPEDFPFYAQWGGCGATLIWEDILLTSATVSKQCVVVLAVFLVVCKTKANIL